VTPPVVGRSRIPRWTVPVVAVAAAGLAAALWWAARPARAPAPTAAGAGARTADPVLQRTPDPLGYVRARVDVNNSGNLGDLVGAYGAWVTRADALPARRAIITALLGHPNLQAGLEALLAAVEADQTPREHDPLWNDLVQAVAGRWRADTLRLGRDMLMLEQRPRPKDLLLESLAALAVATLRADQKAGLASDFIDLYATLKPDQKPAVNRQLHALAGTDVVEIMSGRGLRAGDDQILRLARERQRALDEVARNPVKEAPAEE
jgi:hypothetical protein